MKFLNKKIIIDNNGTNLKEELKIINKYIKAIDEEIEFYNYRINCLEKIKRESVNKKEKMLIEKGINSLKIKIVNCYYKSKEEIDNAIKIRKSLRTDNVNKN